MNFYRPFTHRCTIYALPLEIIQMIVCWVPINPNLLNIALASKQIFGTSMLFSPVFCHIHLRFQQHLSSQIDLWDYLEHQNIKTNAWRCLPFNYQVVIYRHILSTDLPVQDREVFGLEDQYCPYRWCLPSLKSSQVMEAVLKSPGFDVACQGNRAIRWAARTNNCRIVQLLLKDARVDPTDHENYAIRSASFFGRVRVANLLLDDSRVDPSVENNVCIREAAAHGHINIVKSLLDHPKVDPTDGIQDNQSLCLAADNGHSRIVEVLLDDPRVSPIPLSLFLACKRGLVSIVKRLLADPRLDPTNIDGTYSLDVAVGHGFVGVVEVLLNDGRVIPSGTVLLNAALKGYSKILVLLLADDRIDPAHDDNHALELASHKGHIEAVATLLADPRVASGDIRSSICANSHAEIVGLLFKAFNKQTDAVC